MYNLFIPDSPSDAEQNIGTNRWQIIYYCSLYHMPSTKHQLVHFFEIQYIYNIPVSARGPNSSYLIT